MTTCPHGSRPGVDGSAGRAAALGNAARTETKTAPGAQSCTRTGAGRAHHPEPEPSPEPAPQTEPTPAPTGAFDWQALCAYMEHELPIGLYNLLLDPLQAAGELADGTLTLHLNKAPAYPMFNKPDIAEKIPSGRAKADRAERPRGHAADGHARRSSSGRSRS